MTLNVVHLSPIRLSEEHEQRLSYIWNLYQQGMGPTDISDHMNERGLRSIRGRTYYPHLISMNVLQYKKRLGRKFQILSSLVEFD